MLVYKNCVRLFEDNSIKPRRNKPLIQQVRCLLNAVRRHNDLAISLVEAHTGLSTPEAVGNATADRLAARGRTGSSCATAGPPLVPPRPLRRRSPRGPSHSRRRPLHHHSPSRVLCPSRFAFHCPSSGHTLRVARVYRDIPPAATVTIPAGSGDIVGE